MALDLLARIRGERETIGIDVGHYSIKYVKVYHNSRGGKVVVEIDTEPVPDGAIINGEIQRRDGDPVTGPDGKKEKDGYELLSEALTKMMMRHTRDANTDIVASVNCCAGAGGVLADRISVKVPKNGNESAIILQTAQSRPPFDDQDNVIDFEVESREGEEVKANVVAAKNALLDSWAQFFTVKGLKLSAMDVDIFGLLNAYTATASEEDLKQTTAVINIGEKKMSIGFIQEGKFHSMRAMTGGSLDVVISKLCDTLGIDAAKCHEIFETGDLGIVDGYAEAEVEQAMQMAYEEIMAQVEFGLRYYSSSEDSSPLDKILLGGGGASLKGLKEYIAERSGIETDTVNPFRYVECDASVVGESGVSLALSNILAPALGLAMRKFD